MIERKYAGYQFWILNSLVVQSKFKYVLTLCIAHYKIRKPQEKPEAQVRHTIIFVQQIRSYIVCFRFL